MALILQAILIASAQIASHSSSLPSNAGNFRPFAITVWARFSTYPTVRIDTGFEKLQTKLKEHAGEKLYVVRSKGIVHAFEFEGRFDRTKYFLSGEPDSDDEMGNEEIVVSNHLAGFKEVSDMNIAISCNQNRSFGVIVVDKENRAKLRNDLGPARFKSDLQSDKYLCYTKAKYQYDGQEIPMSLWRTKEFPVRSFINVMEKTYFNEENAEFSNLSFKVVVPYWIPTPEIFSNVNLNPILLSDVVSVQVLSELIESYLGPQVYSKFEFVKFHLNSK